MPHPLDSAFDKLRRADEHLETLQSKTAAWLDSKPYLFYPVEQDLFFEHDLFHFKIQVGPVDPPPWDLSVIFGDTLSNLRGALDHLFWELATRRATRVLTWEESRAISFPIVKKGWVDFMAWPGIANFLQKPKGMPKQTWQAANRKRPGTNCLTYRERLAIQQHQPYRRKKAAGTHELAILRDLNDRDKHRSVHPMLVSVEEPGPKFIATRGTIDKSSVSVGQPLVDGAYIADVWVRSTHPNPDVNVELISVAVAFGDSPLGQPIVLRTLKRVREEVGRILAAGMILYG